MRDRNLEHNIRRLEAFLDRWKQLSQYLDRGFRNENFTPEEESAFLELKSTIAQEHQVLATTLANEASLDERALRLLNNVPSLQACRDLADSAANRTATEWHNTFMALQALLGRLSGRKAHLASVSSLRVGLKNVFSNPIFAVFLFAAACYGTFRFANDFVPELMTLWETTK